MTTRRTFLKTGAAAATILAAGGLRARAENAPGITATEIKIGQTMPYSGPASAYGVIGKVETAYFKMLNEQGGINGRKLNLISLDDGYSPPKAVEQVRRLVEQEGVAFFFNTLGTPSNAAIRQYLNDAKIPQLFVSTGSSLFADPAHFKWTVGYNPSYVTEAHIFAKHILTTKPGAKIALLYQNDGFGKDYQSGLKAALGANASQIVGEASYETSEPTVDSQVVTLQGSGADVLVIAATPKWAAQAIRKSYDLGWDATRYVSNVSISIATVLKPAGLEKSKGVITGNYGKDVTDPKFKDDAGVAQWKAFCDKYLSGSEFADLNASYGFSAAQTMAQAIKQCGDDLSRDNILAQATNIKDLVLPMLLPGITLNTSPTNYNPIRQLQLSRFNGESWELFGALLTD